MKKLLLIILMCISLIADEAALIELNTSAQLEQRVGDINSTTKTTALENDFSKASLPMKAFYIVAVPVVAVGAVVYYVALAPFALVRWAFEGKK